MKTTIYCDKGGRMIYYRYHARTTAVHDIDGELSSPIFPNPRLYCTEFDIISETPKGIWLGIFGDKHRWMSNTSKSKYAHPSKTEALDAFIHRKKKQIKILEWNLSEARLGLEMAVNLTLKEEQK